MNFIKPKNIRIISTLVAVVFALPLPLGIFTGLYNWLSPYMLLNSVFVLKSMVLLNILGFIVLFISFFYKRWFCRYICPLGFACDTVSKISPKQNGYLRKIPPIGRWLYLISLLAALFGIPLFILLDPMALFNGFFSVFSGSFQWDTFLSFSGLPILIGLHYFFPGIWCTKICPLGGLLDDANLLTKTTIQLTNKKQEVKGSLQTSRRLFIAGGAGMAAGLLIPKVLQAKKNVLFRPPAALNDPMFSVLCVRCGSCIKSCPTGILQHSRSDSLAWMSPELTFDKGGYCLEDCNLCGTVCPSGSISPFSIEVKKGLFIASVEIDVKNCLLSQQTECDRCKAVCTYDAIKIVPAEQALLMKPDVDLKQCVGCGACAVVCPTECIKMVPGA